MNMGTSSTLEQLDGRRWPAPPEGATPTMLRCHALRRAPLRNFSAEDYRLLINLGINEQQLVPLALSLLEEDPLQAGDYYPGDLLTAVLGIERDFWPAHPAELQRLTAVTRRAEARLPESPSHRRLRRKIDAFLAAHGG